MDERILKAATEITVAVIQRATGSVLLSEQYGESVSGLFKAIYEGIEEATSESTSQEPAGVVF